MKKAEIKKAERLVGMANGLNGITYAVDAEKATKREAGSIWYPVIATKDDGSSWSYWLAADSGSYRGSF